MNETKKLLLIGIALLIVLGAIGLVYYDGYKKSEAEMNKFYEAYNNDEINTIFIGRETCYYCLLLKPILEDFSNEFNFDYTYIDTEVISSSQLGKIINTLELNPEKFGTPYTATVQSGKKLTEINGSVSERKYFNYLKESNIIAEDSKTILNYIDYETYTTLKNNKTSGTIIVIGDSQDEKYLSMMADLKKIKTEYNLNINYFSLLEITQETSAEFSDIILPTMIIFNNNQEEIMLTEHKSYDEYITFLKNHGIIK